ncbi:hypothetical protein [Bordetella trematum]|uniref:hypothetical protein n=1 Tax=Bordetella trematum TaxID=123899 RepID=UPI000D8F357C|nr:hypothetical protein [Bordetella trematum]SPU51662.1 Uncharacterised protein [Bordetella trematum]VDH08414.1 Uncharacterised protein [Bordetella trematum]
MLRRRLLAKGGGADRQALAAGLFEFLGLVDEIGRGVMLLKPMLPAGRRLLAQVLEEMGLPRLRGRGGFQLMGGRTVSIRELSGKPLGKVGPVIFGLDLDAEDLRYLESLPDWHALVEVSTATGRQPARAGQAPVEIIYDASPA